MKRAALLLMALSMLTASSMSYAEEKPAPVKKKIDLKKLGAELKAAVKAGKMTEAEAMAKYKSAAGEVAEKKPLGEKNDLRLQKLGAKLKAAVKAGKMTEAEAWAKYAEAMKKMGMKMKPKKSYGSFYSIVIGRLKSKDIELGEFTMDVDHVTGIYGDRRLKDTIIGKTVKVVGVSGPWLDKLLLIKRGETLKVRSGTLQDKIISLSPKATVLERAVPFDPEIYPIPPKDFKGFRGIVLGKIVEKSDQGYELTLRVSKVVKTFKDNSASKPSVIQGRLMSMRGFYTSAENRKKFDSLRIGDTIRVGAVHPDKTVDALTVHDTFEKAGK